MQDLSVLKMAAEIEAEIDELSVRLHEMQFEGDDVPLSDQFQVFSKWLNSNKKGLGRIKKAERRGKFESEMRMIQQLILESDALTRNLRGF